MAQSEKVPPLTQHHKNCRFHFARSHVIWSVVKWESVLFSDEKRFCLDGPDGFNYYWHCTEKEHVVLSGRQKGGGGVVVWGGISVHGQTPLMFMVGRQATSDYLKIMEEVIIPFGQDNMPIRWIYQQDNAPIHVSKDALDWVSEQRFDLMKWPARSPDLNPIENL